MNKFNTFKRIYLELCHYKIKFQRKQLIIHESKSNTLTIIKKMANIVTVNIETKNFSVFMY